MRRFIPFVFLCVLLLAFPVGAQQGKKISQYPLAGSVADNDLFIVNHNNGDGTYTTQVATRPTILAGVVSLPSQTGQSGKFLTTNGTTASWAATSGAGTGQGKIYYASLNGVTMDADLSDAKIGTDSSAAFQTLLNTASALGPFTVVVDGACKLSNVKLPNNCTIQGTYGSYRYFWRDPNNGGGPFFKLPYDTFVDTANTLLENHVFTPGRGVNVGTWAETGTSSFKVSPSGSVVCTAASASGFGLVTTSTSLYNGTVLARVTPAGAAAKQGIAARVTDVNNLWALTITTAGTFDLTEYNAGTATVRATANVAFANGTQYALQAICNGTTITGKVAGPGIAITTISYTLAGVSARGTIHGLYSGTVGTGTTWTDFGVHTGTTLPPAIGIIQGANAQCALRNTNWSGPAPNGVITNATNATPIVITSNGHGLSTGDNVEIYSVQGNTNANTTDGVLAPGTKVITVVDKNTFSLNGTTGNAPYTSGGFWVHKDKLTTYPSNITDGNICIKDLYINGNCGFGEAFNSNGGGGLANGVVLSTTSVQGGDAYYPSGAQLEITPIIFYGVRNVVVRNLYIFDATQYHLPWFSNAEYVVCNNLEATNPFAYDNVVDGNANGQGCWHTTGPVRYFDVSDVTSSVGDDCIENIADPAQSPPNYFPVKRAGDVTDMKFTNVNTITGSTFGRLLSGSSFSTHRIDRIHYKNFTGNCWYRPWNFYASGSSGNIGTVSVDGFAPTGPLAANFFLGGAIENVHINNVQAVITTTSTPVPQINVAPGSSSGGKIKNIRLSNVTITDSSTTGTNPLVYVNDPTGGLPVDKLTLDGVTWAKDNKVPGHYLINVHSPSVSGIQLNNIQTDNFENLVFTDKAIGSITSSNLRHHFSVGNAAFFIGQTNTAVSRAVLGINNVVNLTGGYGTFTDKRTDATEGRANVTYAAFTAADNTSLNGYTPDLGNAWVIPANGGTWPIVGNKATCTATGPNYGVAYADSGLSDCLIKCTFKIGAAGRNGFCVRATDAANFIRIYATSLDGTMHIIKVVNNVETDLKNAAPGGLAAGTTYTAWIELNGPNISFHISDPTNTTNDTTITASDATYQTNTKHGLNTGAASTDTWDDFTVYSLK